ncbi:tyrosine-type recombinase/integrase [Maridesulfovibrio salexigens]|uniref:Integrase family protein n=1 Tax=Maridesulfovibrio salexigens (strain ATCC 14822 / DSM 2638 / NCIMB 8403 / VKM B-1763) TaxID=526222 RepID=C6BRQ3_MARSD|nr:site-specific integrase [Maridesulfovibrio salexigens]ACS79493.1 integrase family protein [Maridesulfovibrio salexigens DSM 2638]
MKKIESQTSADLSHNLSVQLGKTLEAYEVASIFSVNEEDVLRYYENFGGIEVIPGHYVFFENKILEKVGIMPTLDKRQKMSRWKGVVQVDGVRKEKRFHDESDESYQQAVEWENQQRQNLKKGIIEEVVAQIKKEVVEHKDSSVINSMSSVTLKEFADQYVEYCTGRINPRSVKEKRRHFNTLIAHFTESCFVEEITAFKMNKFLQEVLKTKTGNMVNIIMKHLKAAWSWAGGFVEGFPQNSDPFRNIQKFPEQRHPRYVPPKEDLDKVFDVAEGQDRVMLKTFYYTGGRKNEIFSLKWEDVLFDSNQIRLWTNKRKHGNRESNLIPMVKELKRILTEWKKACPCESDYVFIEVRKKAPTYGQRYVYRKGFMERHCDKAGVKRFGFHGIRHLFATTLYNNGQPLAVVQKMMRHKNPNTTVRYLHEMGLDRALEAVEGVL